MFPHLTQSQQARVSDEILAFTSKFSPETKQGELAALSPSEEIVQTGLPACR
jgi:hypothetical protein